MTRYKLSKMSMWIPTNVFQLSLILHEKLPSDTRKELERSLSSSDTIPTLQTVVDKIQSYLRTLELLNIDQKESKQSSQQLIRKSFQSLVSKGKAMDTRICVLCNGNNHTIHTCPQFLELSIKNRIEKVKVLELCYNCLSKNHMVSNCTSKRNCNVCGRRHHSLLHNPTFKGWKETTAGNDPSPSTSKSNEISKKILTSNVPDENLFFQTTLLSTAVVKAKSSNGETIWLRALVDLGGEACVVTELAVQNLKLHNQHCSVDVLHLDSVKSSSNSFVTFTIESCHDDFLTTIHALVMKSLMKKLPSQEFNCSDWLHIQGLHLADPNFNKFGPIDLILDADVCSEIFLPGIRRGSLDA